jgi:hypothetical protein
LGTQYISAAVGNISFGEQRIVIGRREVAEMMLEQRDIFFARGGCGGWWRCAGKVKEIRQTVEYRELEGFANLERRRVRKCYASRFRGRR